MPKTASWKNGTNCCSWDGVTCHMSKDYVIGLDLSSWLQGALHSNSTLFLLRNLQRLNLADMSRISPTSLTNLSSTLTSLRLDGCRLQGTFPINIFHLPNLCILSLFDNSNLMGALPQTNWSSSPLVRLSLSFTKFQGPIPDSVGNFTSLEYLHLDGSKFTGSVPPTLWNLDRLSSLRLGGINLSGTVDFDMLARLKYLEDLYLWGNLNLMLPNNGNRSFPRLKELILSGVNLTEFPYFLSSLEELEWLNLYGNKISGPIPEWFGRMWSKTMIILDLSSNNFTGEIPSSICQLRNDLRTIRLSQNRLEGTLPRSLVNCKNLEVLDLSENKLEDRFPYWLDTLPNLQVLDLRSNKLRGLINSFGKNNHPFPKLHIFDLSDNKFYGHLPAKYIANFIAMKDKARSASQYMWVNHSQATYQDSVMVVMKGFTIELQLPPSTSSGDGEEKAQFGHWIEWWVVAMGYGCGISFGISTGYIMLETRRPKWLVRKVERWLMRMVERKRRKKKTRSKKNAAQRNHARYLSMTDFAH
ncbi:hypothetical protein CRG98_038159 [Punica granatum]|uniref:Leucine-rich repeat-containing N-terminal plant-type domain-containing protein n=1 Tax=Punica granatum TaxID=22663 RepID=A0A2I0ICN9_PUNGR|nr:hypothetical protein CRG98_038159 [Punica granatum]